MNLGMNPSELISQSPNLGKGTHSTKGQGEKEKVSAFSNQLNQKSKSWNKESNLKTGRPENLGPRSLENPQYIQKENSSGAKSYSSGAPLTSEQKKTSSFKTEIKNKKPIDALQERAAMQQFLGDMKKINVNAQDVITAFSNLSPEQLEMAPEENVDLIVDQFGLQGTDRDQARQYFVQMLNGTDATQTQQYLESGKGERQYSLNLLSQRELNKNKIQKSIDDMNQAFFVNNRELSKQQNQEQSEKSMWNATALASRNPSSTQPVTEGSTQGSETLPGTLQQKNRFSESTFFPMNEKGAISPYQNSQQTSTSSLVESLKEGLTSASKEELPVQEFRSEMTVPEDLNVSKMEAFVPKGNGLGSLESSEGLNVDLMSSSGTSESPILGMDSETSSGTQQEGDFSSLSQSMSQDSEGVEEGASDSSENFETVMGVKSETSTGVKQDIATKLKAFLPENQASEADLKANIDNIVTRTNSIAQKGGGEMKVQLNPEGLGELHLKVAVKDGMVNVEMLTESDGAKKLLERGMGELKASLAGHKLSVEELKVDVSNNLSDFLEKQEENRERNLAQQFLGDFRRQNDNFRQSFFNQGLAGYKEQTGNDENSSKIQAMEVQAQKKSEPNRRLNLVA